ncbi:PE-PPE domain-containing protein [Gordonia sp. ABSL1-1]|uniref:cutinase family protein n=1 Tax=Gordonia sp. ABSL1-1 TaxID=3053923 RepID=UPI0025732FD4|nr:PE-PPE domain-containing protein [Gordonia sp. ABSL1-1]MDL9937177.1 PE-PPE domain-containing protein [Gordonia sp. ABSL1-1]
MSDWLATQSIPPASVHRRRRQTTVLLAVLAAFAVVVAYCLPGVIGRAGAEDYDCGGGGLVVVGGTNDPEAAALIGVEQRYTGQPPANGDHAGDQAYRVIRADYPTTLWPLGATGYDDSVAQGKASTTNSIASYQARCPGKPVVVTGYSQGARVAGDVLSDIGQADAKGEPITVALVDAEGNYVDENGNPVDEPVYVTISTDQLSGELYSDPRQAGNKQGRGIELSLIGIIPGLTMTGSRGTDDEDPGWGTLDGKITSVCVDGDPICDLPDPLYDPIGAIDGLLGYFTKHGLYPWQMYRDPAGVGGRWTTGRTVTCTDNICRVSADSAFAELFQGWADDLGVDVDLGDFLSGRPTLDIPFGLELTHLRPVVNTIEGLLPPLPKLGYGAYLPDLFVFEDILGGIVNLAPDQFRDGVDALAGSLRSIVALPKNFVRYWVGRAVAAGPLIGDEPTATALTTRVAADENATPQVRTALHTLAATVEEPSGTAPGADVGVAAPATPNADVSGDQPGGGGGEEPQSDPPFRPETPEQTPTGTGEDQGGPDPDDAGDATGVDNSGNGTGNGQSTADDDDGGDGGGADGSATDGSGGAGAGDHSGDHAGADSGGSESPEHSGDSDTESETDGGSDAGATN